MTGDRNGDGGSGVLFLHDNMTAAAPNFFESVVRKDFANLVAGQAF